MTFGLRVGSTSILDETRRSAADRAYGHLMLGAVKATAASAPEEADDVPSTPAAALGELDYNIMQFNALRDSRASRLPMGVERAATLCHRTAAPAPQEARTLSCRRCDAARAA